VPYLTGDEPDGECSVSIIIPNDARIRQALVGAISELSYPHMWESFGTLDPDATASILLSAMDSLTVECMGASIDMIVFAYRTTTQSLSAGVLTQLIDLTTVDFDTGQWDDANDRVVIDADGIYACAVWAAMPAPNLNLEVVIKVNDASFTGASYTASGNQFAKSSVPFLLPLTVDDTVSAWATATGAASIATQFGKLGLLIYRLGNLA